MDFLFKYRKDFIVFAAVAVLYFALRLPNLTIQPIFADEAIYIRWAQIMKAEPTLRFVSLSDGKTPLFMWAMTPMFKIFDDPLFAGRFLSVLSGFMTMTGLFFLARRVFNKAISYWTILLYAACPYAVFFDRMALVDSMLAAFTVWVIYFSIWLLKSLRLDIAMILGYLLGGALLVKTPAMMNLLILPLSVVGIAKKRDSHYLLKLLLYWGVAILIALAIYNVLRLGPGFQLLSSRNADYVFSPIELIGRPLDPFIPHLNDISDWFPKFLTIPVLIAAFIGILMSILSFKRLAWVILIWIFVPLVLNMAFLKTFTARYLLSSIPPLLIFSGVGIDYVLKKIGKYKLLATGISLIVLLSLSFRFDYLLLTNLALVPLPLEERRGYLEDWTAGYGFKEIAQFVLDENKNQPVAVGTEGFFGTLPEGLQIYLDKANIPIIGGPAMITESVRNATKDHLTFYVGDKSRTEGALQGVELIKEFPKVKPLDNSPQNAIMLYKVLPK